MREKIMIIAFASILTTHFTLAQTKNTHRNRRARTSCDSKPAEAIDNCQDCVNSCDGFVTLGESGCKCESECMFGVTYSCSHLGDDWEITNQRCCPSSCSSAVGNDCIDCFSCTGYDHPRNHRHLQRRIHLNDPTFQDVEFFDNIPNSILEGINDHYSNKHRSTKSLSRSTGLVIGIALLVIALVGSIAGVVFFFVFYKRQKQRNLSSDPQVPISCPVEEKAPVEENVPVEAKLVTPQCEETQDSTNNVSYADVIADKVETLEDGSVIKTITATSSIRQVMTISERTLPDGAKEVSTSLAV